MVFGLFGKKRKNETFKARVDEFWGWFPTVSDRYLQTIDAGKCASLAGEFGDACSRMLPHLAWVFGPGEEGGHSLTISGEGVTPKQILADAWCDQAVKLPRWTFYGSRQPSPPSRLSGLAIQVSEQKSVDTDGMIFQTHVDDSEQKIDLVAWHPNFDVVPKEHHSQILYLLLDEAFGEFGTDTYFGSIDIKPFAASAKTKTLIELPKFAQQAFEYYGWNLISPLKAYRVYELKEPMDGPRGDTVVGSSCISQVVFDYISNGGKLKDNPLEGTGAEFGYLAFPASMFPPQQQLEYRGKIEDMLGDALGKQNSGRTLGGAVGSEEVYIDLIYFDGDESRAIVKDCLEGMHLRGRYRFESMS